jgi:hypothetical protein
VDGGRCGSLSEQSGYEPFWTLGCYNELRAKVNKVIASSSEMKDHPVMMINMHRWMESMECEQYTH